MEGASKKQEPGLSATPIAPNQREFLVEVYGPLFGAIGRLALPAPVRLSDFVNEREGFLRLTDVEFMADGSASPEMSAMKEYLINKTGIELICQPADAAIERHADVDDAYGKSLWHALSKMAFDTMSDLRVPKERHYVQVHTHRFTVSAYLHIAHGAALEAVLSHLPLKFIPVTNASARFIGRTGEHAVIDRKLMLVNRDHILLVASGVASGQNLD
jgi:hypothetical protein